MLGLPLLRKMGLFHKHRLMIIETIVIHKEQRNLDRYDSKVLARYDSKVVDKCTKYTNEDFAEAEVVDVTEEWMESMRCMDNVQFDSQGPNYIHPE